MEDLISRIKIKVSEKIYLKDPEGSDLGKRIVKESIKLIDDLGLEKFTFKKLAETLNTTESSIYRYFENKHRLLLYLIAVYWGWLEYRLVFATNNITSSKEKLKVALEVLADTTQTEFFPLDLDAVALKKIVISESSKAYLTKEVDHNDREGLFSGYHRLCSRLSQIISDFNSSYSFPKSLASLVLEGILIQKYFSEHLPSMTDVGGQEKLKDFLVNLVLSTTK